MGDARPLADYRHRLGAIAAAPMSDPVIFNVSHRNECGAHV
jgi:hypothetical protein